MAVDISEILDFLPCETPNEWVDAALAHPEELLIDHANCEKKAAGTALNLMFRYVDKLDLLNKMSRLAREELRHFEQVLAIMKKRGVAYRHISSARYANGLRELCRSSDPGKLVDILVCGALIEARSCERFARIAPELDDELGAFYLSLLKSESRHFKDYLSLAQRYSDEPIAPRVALFCEREKELILTPDEVFRFHSGPLLAA
ncbi:MULTISPECIES: tRNA isopentenyl-2-thiomethyl-A-37 hydroxylase MiaE [Spongiibacter]|uniref:tRNA-(ms[2]io[6]A)-hydroxylase n=1 Tax=Spongiibacter TaxID=630749 RepID=UPI000C0A888B|nr:MULTISPECIES: tRNA isopentenyl-2-thiomethyl-A-37 hydroxylase MiaE [Spongiibacter]MAK44214.1 tRNA-(ms[2]io[6]A)-hydroxylase [Spongiibacter sp.]MBM7423698.1 tRNA-(ms[2]io[6]A)-hydroxylase [Spongiibacter marinus]MEE2653958.1 tRNA isopentenyl-2-thiomethyl-A-37 hydroxylase MiaE [Pseudomonadota bacterium]|tara:strand:+ start:5136 stop:5747 length:612 start_codon:yes stop_codon:yes gene_type:complete